MDGGRFKCKHDAVRALAAAFSARFHHNALGGTASIAETALDEVLPLLGNLAHVLSDVHTRAHLANIHA